MNNTKESAICPVAKKCGGCQYQGIPYEEQRKKKEKTVRALCGKLGVVHPTTGMENPLHYRNKIHASFRKLKNGEIVSGKYEENSHRVVPVDNCRIENETAAVILNDICRLIQSFRILLYNEDTGTGLLRHVLIRTAYSTGEVLVVLVLSSPVFPSKRHFVEELRKKHPEIRSIVINVNHRHTSMVLGDKEQVIYGPGYIEDELCGFRFRISPRSFYQVNPEQAEKVYRQALALAGLTGKERVIDAYCGTGTIGIIASPQAGEVIGVELNPAAVKDALVNARAGKCKNIRFIQADAEKYLIQMASHGEKADVILMDPPRAGSSPGFLKAAVNMNPKKIIYISCNPETLARDASILRQLGYKSEGFYPFDMFPFCDDVETVSAFVPSGPVSGKNGGKNLKKIKP